MVQCEKCESLIPMYYEYCPVCGEKLDYKNRWKRAKEYSKKETLLIEELPSAFVESSDYTPDDIDIE